MCVCVCVCVCVYFALNYLSCVLLHVLKVPHYDVHGVNEIHGQHFRHHPPGAKKDSEPSRDQTIPVRPFANSIP